MPIFRTVCKAVQRKIVSINYKAPREAQTHIDMPAPRPSGAGGAIAEFERELIQARMAEGRKRAADNGVLHPRRLNVSEMTRSGR